MKTNSSETPLEASFSNLGLSNSLATVIGDLGYETATPIQARAIPALISGKDVVAQSKTGSGKTLAFSIPLLEKIDVTSRTVQALVLCPTRELCTQVAREIRRLGRDHRGLQVLILSGGQPARPQAAALYGGVHIVVGTPGRVLDHLDRGRLDLSWVKMLVLDEADRMLDMGFEDQMESILEEIPRTRQTAFFSATYPKNFGALSKRHQLDPIEVKIEAEENSKASIRHLHRIAETDEKLDALIEQLKLHAVESAFVFCNLKVTVSELADQLNQRGYSCAGLHGDLEQIDRDRVMAKFRNGSTRVLVATDVAARGLDVENVQLVVCFDLPHQPDDYIHRVGRTGRAGREGLAISLIAPREMMRIYEIEKYAGIKFSSAESLVLPKVSKDVQAVKGAAMETLYIAGGRKEKVRPGDILGALTGEAGGLDGSDVGKIEIHDHFSYVAVSSKVAPVALQRLRSGRIKGRKFLVKMVE